MRMYAGAVALSRPRQSARPLRFGRQKQDSLAVNHEFVGLRGRPATSTVEERVVRDLTSELQTFALPDGEAQLLQAAALALDAYDGAIRAKDESAARQAHDRREAVVWKLNGGTFFACRADPETSAGYLVERFCAAEPGTVPKWGQSGQFLICVEGMRAVVKYTDNGVVWDNAHFIFHAVDLGAPFISETGYRSHTRQVPFGFSVIEAAEEIMSGLIESQGRKVIAVDYRRRMESQGPPAWLAKVPEPHQGERCYRESSGQMAFGF